MKIALVRVFSQEFEETTEWVKDHMTDFVEVSSDEFYTLRDFVYAYNNNPKKERRYIIVEDETHLLPKTIGEALEYAVKQKMLLAEKAKNAEKLLKEKAKLKKQREVERLKAEVAQLENYKIKLAKMEKEI